MLNLLSRRKLRRIMKTWLINRYTRKLWFYWHLTILNGKKYFMCWCYFHELCRTERVITVDWCYMINSPWIMYVMHLFLLITTEAFVWNFRFACMYRLCRCVHIVWDTWLMGVFVLCLCLSWNHKHENLLSDCCIFKDIYCHPIYLYFVLTIMI